MDITLQELQTLYRSCSRQLEQIISLSQENLSLKAEIQSLRQQNESLTERMKAVPAAENGKHPQAAEIEQK